MRKTNREFACAGLVALAILLSGCGASPKVDNQSTASGAKPPNQRGLVARLLGPGPAQQVLVPEGTLIAVTLDQALSSETSKSGEVFDASVATPILVDGKTIIPNNAQVRGLIVEAHSSGRLKTPGRLVLTLTSIEVDGTMYNIDTSDARRSGKSHTKHNVIFVGGGAAAGAVLGAIVGGGKGAAIGSAVGAGGGTAAAAATGKMDVRLPAETRLSFPLSQGVSIRVRT